MALSQWDLNNLTPQEQQQILGYKSQYDGADAATRQSLNNAANAIRQQYGYSGGGDGSQYIPNDQFTPPTPPTISQYESPYRDEIKDIMDQMRNIPDYKSPYEDLINRQLSSIMNRPAFSYDPESDAAYQAFRDRALRAGDKAYADNLGGLSAMTGGRPNSWAGTVASQARNQYVLQAEEAVIQFEDRAYGRYRDETSDMYNLLNVLNSQDEIAYSRYRDQIGDTKDLADMVLRLEDRDFEQYKFMTEQQWRTFDYEYQAYNDALKFKQQKIAEALDRTNLQGYVNNQDSITLGVPTGTLSQSARERAEAMEDYIKKQQLDIEQFRKEKEISHEFDLKLLNAREAISARSGSGGSGSSSSFAMDGSYVPTKDEASKIKSEYDAFAKFVESDDYKRKTVGMQWKAIQEYQEKVIGNVERNLYGKNSLVVGDIILSQVETHPLVKKITEDYVKAYNKVQGNKQVLTGPVGGRYAE